jgi:uncharacterized damage-inducible protein DinB
MAASPPSYNNPSFPFGEYTAEARLTDPKRAEWLTLLREFPEKLEASVAGLSPTQLATCYRRWTVTQIVHHLADAQLNWLLRFKQGLTTQRPTIIPFEESAWVELADSLAADIQPSLAIIRGVSGRWCELCQYMPPEDFGRVIYHPERDAELTLDQALSMATWHCYHHLGQIQWLQQNGFHPPAG